MTRGFLAARGGSGAGRGLRGSLSSKSGSCLRVVALNCCLVHVLLGADAGAHITASTGRRATTLREASHVQLALRPAALLQLLLVLRR